MPDLSPDLTTGMSLLSFMAMKRYHICTCTIKIYTSRNPCQMFIKYKILMLFFSFWVFGILVQHKPLKDLNGQVCEICGDEIGLTVDGDLFVACNECGFPVCRPCYEYERREGSQLCPQCRTRYKRLKGKL